MCKLISAPQASTDVIVASEIYRRACAVNLGQMFALHSP
jgi:hypothetical protein